MKCFILAAGYATRLYPLTEKFPKPLLEVGGKTILDWLIDDVDTLGKIDEYVVISNHKFFSHFEKWARAKSQKITVLDDGTSTNETRLGAVRDVEFALKSIAAPCDTLVLAGDNLLDFSLTDFINYAEEKNTSCIMRYYEADSHRLTKSGVVNIDQNDVIIAMEEKPSNPKSNWCCPPFYFLKKDDILRVGEAINEGCGTDAPGSYIVWLSKKAKVHAMQMPGKRYDIGNLESYEKVREEYKGYVKA